jgi:hypothetical protein
MIFGGGSLSNIPGMEDNMANASATTPPVTSGGEQSRQLFSLQQLLEVVQFQDSQDDRAISST